MASQYLKNFSSPYSLTKLDPPSYVPPHDFRSAQPIFDSKYSEPLPAYQSKFSEPIPKYPPPDPSPFDFIRGRTSPPEYTSSVSFQQRDFQKPPSDPPFLTSSPGSNFARPLNRKPPTPFQERLANLPPKQDPPPRNFMTSYYTPGNPQPKYSPFESNETPIFTGKPAAPMFENPTFRLPPHTVDSPFRGPPDFREPILNRPLVNSIIRSPEGSRFMSYPNNENIPFRMINEPAVRLQETSSLAVRAFPMMETIPGRNIREPPPQPIFYSHKLNDQTKENNVFPDFITAFGTYSHYDLATRESKFRRNLKTTTSKSAGNSLIEDLSYLNVNFLQQSHYDKVFDALKNFIFFDRSVEKLKEELIHKSDFDIHLLFSIFDENESGQIVVSEWKEGLAKLGIKAEDNDIYLMVSRYSRDGNKKVGFGEFCDIVLPSTGTNREYILKKETRHKYLSNESQHLASKLFKMILNVSYSSELVRREIAAENVNVKEVFNFIDGSKGGLITKDEIKGFLNKYNFHLFNEDLAHLMSRFDGNRSGKINFKEFEYELMPQLIME